MSEQTERAYDKVLAYIREEIRKGNLRRGERLPPERDLADLLGISRNSVREALRTMSMMGFISSVHGAGNFVTCDLEKNLSESLRLMLMLGETNFLQVSQLRRGLEAETARLAASRILPSQLAQLEALVQQMREEPDPLKASRYDQEFHRLLCEAAGNRLIRAMFSAMLTTVNAFISTMYTRIVSEEEPRRMLHDAHQEVVDALRERDEGAAIRAIWHHFDIVNAAIEQEEQA